RRHRGAGWILPSRTGRRCRILACANARQKYGIDARCGSAESIPLPDASVDVAVSFETIEHIVNPARFVREAKRVLARTSGIFIVSTPNRPVYNRNGERN